jgi:diguanylate cyclase (GGDEF)-like protein
MPFRHAARTATIISSIYIWGMFEWDFPTDETLFTCIMLLFTNVVAAYCCYQLEHVVRRSFLESKELGQLAERDGLTSLYNRRSYDEYIDRIWRQSRREQTQLTVMLIDIDHFKAFNDFYGHQAGDDALKKVASVIADGAQRPLDFAARFGGEEFALVLYGPATESGSELPEHLREGVEALKIRHEKSTTAQYLTVSVGVAIVTPGGERSKAGAIQMADEALYQAKEEGRNCVVVKKSLDTDIQTGRFRSSKKTIA